MGRIGPVELVIIGVVLLFIIGPAKIPQFARSIGQGLQEFRKGVRAAREEVGEALKENEKEDEPPPTPRGKAS